MHQRSSQWVKLGTSSDNNILPCPWNYQSVERHLHLTVGCSHHLLPLHHPRIRHHTSREIAAKVRIVHTITVHPQYSAPPVQCNDLILMCCCCCCCVIPQKSQQVLNKCWLMHTAATHEQANNCMLAVCTCRQWLINTVLNIDYCCKL